MKNRQEAIRGVTLKQREMLGIINPGENEDLSQIRTHPLLRQIQVLVPLATRQGHLPPHRYLPGL